MYKNNSFTTILLEAEIMNRDEIIKEKEIFSLYNYCYCNIFSNYCYYVFVETCSICNDDF